MAYLRNAVYLMKASSSSIGTVDATHFCESAIPGLFLLIFSFFLQCKEKYGKYLNININDTSVDGVLRTRTRGGRMEGAELRQLPPLLLYIFVVG